MKLKLFLMLTIGTTTLSCVSAKNIEVSSARSPQQTNQDVTASGEIQGQLGTSILIGARIFQIRLIGTELSFADLNAKLEVVCTVPNVPIFPGDSNSKPCGHKIINLAIDNNGNFNFPLVEKFQDRGGNDAGNYKIRLSLVPKSKPDDYFGLISVGGKQAYQFFKNMPEELKLMAFKGAVLPLKIAGVDLIGSNLTKKVAQLTISFSDKQKELPIGHGRLISTLNGGFRLLIQNPKNYSQELSTLKEIRIPDLFYLFQGDLGNSGLTATFHFSIPAGDFRYQSVFLLKADSQALSLIDSTDLDLKLYNKIKK